MGDARKHIEGPFRLVTRANQRGIRLVRVVDDSPGAGAALVAEYDNPNVVKVVVNVSGRALYFSRRTIPFLRELLLDRDSALGTRDSG